MSLSQAEESRLLTLLKQEERWRRGNKIWTYFPDEGPFRRELYKKHLQFFEAGATYRERGFIAANRVGKSEGGGGYETTIHLTGQYPHWWKGRRFARPIRAVAAGDTAKTVREIIQAKLLGPIHEMGIGLIPAETISKTTPKQGVPEAIDTVYVKHVSGGLSKLVFKSYDQKRIAFQGEEQDLVWLDEEPPLDIYTECLLRTMTTGGMVMLTFTPLIGMSETVLQFLPGGDIQERADGSKAVVMAGWDDVPHLDERTKAELLAAIPPFQRDARSKGIPQLGAGAIYPVPESEFVVDDFEIPAHWPRAYALDVGWNRTAGLWGAWNRDADCVYLYSEHYRSQAEPAVHAQSIRSRGEWVPGVIDPASRGRSQADGNQLIQMYKDLGLDLDFAQNAVEAGIYEVWSRLSTGRMKVFKSLNNWLSEFRLYRRDEKGRIVKQNDHLMDDTRYLVMSGLARAIVKPVEQPKVREYMPSGVWVG
jgi:phage terminase large subunit-like protein